MHMFSRVTGLALALAFAAGAPVVSGCYVEAGPEPVYASAGYQPDYYDGYVVYYDGVGHPYYYVNGGVVWIASTSPYYGRYVNHWRANRRGYQNWNAHYGSRYRSYRRPAHRQPARPAPAHPAEHRR
jgi:hypothetical protein